MYFLCKAPFCQSRRSSRSAGPWNENEAPRCNESLPPNILIIPGPQIQEQSSPTGVGMRVKPSSELRTRNPGRSAKRKRDSAQPQARSASAIARSLKKERSYSRESQPVGAVYDRPGISLLYSNSSGTENVPVPLICVRCRIRRELSSNASRRCIVERLSHMTRSPTFQTLHHTDASSPA